MTTKRINNLILLLYNFAFVLILCAFALFITLILTLIIDEIWAKLNGAKVYITPIERINAERDLHKMQLVRTKINGQVLEIEVSKKLIKWAFKNRFNYWLFIKYIIFKAQMSGKG